MHEASICEGIITSAIKIAENEKLESVSSIKVIIGQLHHVINSVLLNVFDIMKEEHTVLKKSVLEIENKELIVKCNECGKNSKLVDVYFICTYCFSPDVKVISGEQMHIVSVSGTSIK